MPIPNTQEASSSDLFLCWVRSTNGYPLTGLFLLFRPLSLPDLPEGVKAPSSFTVALSNHDGCLSLVTPDEKAATVWDGFYNPDKQRPAPPKLIHGQEYECYCVRHPDLNLVRRAQRELESETRGELTASWTSQTVTTEIISFPPPTPKGKKPVPPNPPDQYDRHCISFPDEPKNFYPNGDERFNGWLLYKDMPHEYSDKVRDAVTRLQNELGALRYIVGADPPYVPEIFDKKLNNKLTTNIGIFDSRTLNSVYQFSRDVQNGIGWQVTDRSATVALAGRMELCSTSLAYLRGKIVFPDGPTVAADGVVDIDFARALAGRYEAGICNSRAYMVSLPALETQQAGVEAKEKFEWSVWMRLEAAESLYAWRSLVRALGFPQTVAANHTYRSIAVDVGAAGYGRSWKSIHKCGYAIDTGLKANYYEVVDDWPIFYDAYERVEKTGWFKIRWRLYGVSNLIIDTPEGISQCIANLTLAASDNHPLAGLLRPAAEKLLAEIEKPADFVKKYFRETIRQWRYDPWDPDGGKEGNDLFPSDARASQRAPHNAQIKDLREQRAGVQKQIEAADAVGGAEKASKAWKDNKKSLESNRRSLDSRIASQEKQLSGKPLKVSRFIDLTLLAAEVSLKPIDSWNNNYVDTAKEWGRALVTINSAKLLPLADALLDLKTNHPELDVKIGKNTYKGSQIDASFLVNWAKAIVKCKSCKINPPEITCAVSRDEPGKARIAEISELLRQFSTRRFLRTQNQVVDTGEGWAAKIESKLEEIKETAPANLKDASKGSNKKDPNEWTFTLAPDVSDPDRSTFLKALLPLLAATYRKDTPADPILVPPNTGVTLAARGAPIALEWWHFQRTDLIAGQKWGSLLTELGFDADIICTGPWPFLHYRYGMGYPDNVAEIDAH